MLVSHFMQWKCQDSIVHQSAVFVQSTVPSSPRTQYGPLDENSDPGNIGTQGCWQDHIPTAKGVYNSSGCELVNLEQRQANYKQLRFLPQ
jgi:hypothetical protein